MGYVGSVMELFNFCNLNDERWCSLERKEEQMVYIQKHDREEGFYRSHGPIIKKCKFANKENVFSFAVLYPEVYSLLCWSFCMV